MFRDCQPPGRLGVPLSLRPRRTKKYSALQTYLLSSFYDGGKPTLQWRSRTRMGPCTKLQLFLLHMIHYVTRIYLPLRTIPTGLLMDWLSLFSFGVHFVIQAQSVSRDLEGKELQPHHEYCIFFRVFTRRVCPQ